MARFHQAPVVFSLLCLAIMSWACRGPATDAGQLPYMGHGTLIEDFDHGALHVRVMTDESEFLNRLIRYDTAWSGACERY